MVDHVTLDEALSHASDQLAQAMAHVTTQKLVLIEPMSLPYKEPSPMNRSGHPPGTGVPIRSYERYGFTHHDHRAVYAELRPGTANNDVHHPVTRKHIADNLYKQRRS